MFRIRNNIVVRNSSALNGVLEMEGFRRTFSQLYATHEAINESSQVEYNGTQTCSSGNGAASDGWIVRIPLLVNLIMNRSVSNQTKMFMCTLNIHFAFLRTIQINPIPSQGITMASVNIGGLCGAVLAGCKCWTQPQRLTATT